MDAAFDPSDPETATFEQGHRMVVPHNFFLATTRFFHLLGGPKEQVVKMKGFLDYTDDDFAFVVFYDGVVFVWSEQNEIYGQMVNREEVKSEMRTFIAKGRAIYSLTEEGDELVNEALS